MARKTVIAERKFGQHKWELSRIFAHPLDAHPYTRLQELGGKERTDYPIRYVSGKVAYDRPEIIPQAVKEWVSRELNAYYEKKLQERGR